MSTERDEALEKLAHDGDTYELPNCRHCGQTIENDDGIWFHPDTMQARCDGADDEPGLAWSDMLRQAEPRGTLRLRIQPDDMSIMDEQGEGVWCGRLEWDQPHPYNVHRVRPDGFDGRAEVIHRDGNARLWWQVPADIEIGSDVHQAHRRAIKDLIEYGYSTIAVELLQGEDAYHRPIVVNAASLGGVEPFPSDDYRSEVVGELIDEVLT